MSEGPRAPRRGERSVFRSMRERNFRIWFLGALISNVGLWIQATTLDWLVLTVFTERDAVALGITMAFQFAPGLLLMPLTGWISDILPRRSIMQVTQSLMALLTVVMAILILAGVAELGIVLCYALVFGVVNAFENPARQSIVTDLVDRARRANAVALKSLSYNTARLVGPAIAGVLLVVIDSSWLLVIAAATNLVMVGALAAIRLAPAARRRREARQRLTGGLRFVWRRKDLLVVTVIMAFVSALGFNFPIMLATMTLELGGSAGGYGLLSSLLGVGSMIGAMLAARRERARLGVIVAGATGFAAASLVAAAMPGYPGFALSMLPLGAAAITMLTTANGYVQTTSGDSVRGRVMAVYMAVLLTATPIGAPLVGTIVQQLGSRAALLTGAAAAAIGALIGLLWLIVVWRWRPTMPALRAVRARRPRAAEAEELAAHVGITSPLREPDVVALPTHEAEPRAEEPGGHRAAR